MRIASTARMDIDGVVSKWCSAGQHWVDETIFYKDSSKTDGLGSRCKMCSSSSRRERHIRGTYGIGLGEYEALLEEQSGRCAICEDLLSSDSLHVHIDHCHNTNEVRGILCRACNHLLGNAKDDVNILLNAIDYLWEHDARIKRIVAERVSNPGANQVQGAGATRQTSPS